MNKNMKTAIVLLLTLGIIHTPCVFALEKNETVYQTLDADGRVKETLVNEHLKNIDFSSDEIEDVTDLKNILNLNGDEKFRLNGEMLRFENKGKEIYYSGVSNREVPISMNVSYLLDGKDISIDDLLGKSGHVTIKIQYQNQAKQIVTVASRNKEVYTPFVVTMGTIIPTKNVTNVEVTNGKVTSTGNKNVVMALATPGLYESLQLDSLKEMDTVTVSYDVKNFKLNPIYSMATNKLLDDSDLQVFNQLDEVYGNVDTLSQSSSILVDGSRELLDGSKKLQDGVRELSRGLNSAYDGSQLLEDVLSGKIRDAKNSSSIDQDALNLIVTTVKNSIAEEFSPEYEQQLRNQAILGLQASPDYQNYKMQLDAAEQAGIQDLISMCQTPPTGYEEFCSSKSADILAYQTGKTVLEKMEVVAGDVAVQTAKMTANEVAEKVAREVATSVASQAKSETISQLEILNNTIHTLVQGLASLSDGSNTLDSGASLLTSGASELSLGITQFDEEGIQKIANFVGNDLKDKTETVQKLKELSDNYHVYTMKKDTDSGNVKFVMMIDGKEKTVVKKKTTKTVKKESFWDKIVGIFR